MFSPSPSLIGPEYFYDAEKQANRPIGSSRPSSHTETHIKLAPSKSIVLHIAHHVQSFSKKFGTFISLVVFILVTYILLSHPNISTPPLSNYRIKTGSSTEAYVTLVSDIETNPWPAIQAQLLLFQTLHDPLTSDPSRDFVVLVTPDVSDEYVQELQVQGAIVIRILPLTRSRLSDTGPSVEEDLTKLRVFGLTQYDRVLFIDPTFVLAKSLEGIWESPAARSRYGLASNSINERMHDNPPDGRGEFFNDGFWMAKPSEQLYKEMLQEVEKGFVGGEPGFLNAFFVRTGGRPWGRLARKWTAQWAHGNDIRAGVVALQADYWDESARWSMDPDLIDFWRQKLGRMEGYWAAERNVPSIAIPHIAMPPA